MHAEHWTCQKRSIQWWHPRCRVSQTWQCLHTSRSNHTIFFGASCKQEAGMKNHDMQSAKWKSGQKNHWLENGKDQISCGSCGLSKRQGNQCRGIHYAWGRWLADREVNPDLGAEHCPWSTAQPFASRTKRPSTDSCTCVSMCTVGAASFCGEQPACVTGKQGTQGLVMAKITNQLLAGRPFRRLGHMLSASSGQLWHCPSLPPPPPIAWS